MGHVCVCVIHIVATNNHHHHGIMRRAQVGWGGQASPTRSLPLLPFPARVATPARSCDRDRDRDRARDLVPYAARSRLRRARARAHLRRRRGSWKR